MGDYNRGGRFGGKKSGGNFKGRRGSNDRDEDRPTMHQAVCNDCGNDCEVPFRPTGERPIFCSDCFKNKDDSSRGRDSRPRFENKRPNQFTGTRNTENLGKYLEQINVTLNKILQALSPVLTTRIKEIEASKTKQSKITQKKEIDTNAINSLVAAAIDNKTKKKTATKKSVAKKKKKKKK